MPAIETADLSIAYADHGARDASTVLLLHGWPDCAASWDVVAAALVDAGYRVIVPELRGFGGTRVKEGARRSGDSATLARDAIALLDALGIGSFDVAGHDWGSNAAEALAVGWPARVRHLAMLATPPRLGGLATPPFAQAQRYWYHWFMATARGSDAVREDRRGFARLHWQNWSPPGWFDDATFDAAAAAWDNADWHAVTIHSYRSRWGEAAPDPASAWLDAKVKETKTLSTPTAFLYGEADGVTSPELAAKVHEKFDGPFAKVALAGVGHFIQREAPFATARVLTHLFGDGDPAELPSLVQVEPTF